MCVVLCIHVFRADTREWLEVPVFRWYASWLMRQSFSLSWSSLSRLCWLASGPQGLNPCLPRRVGSGVNSRMPSFWISVLETKQILILTKQALYQLNYFPNPGPIFCYELWILSRNNACTVVRSQYVWLIVYTCYKNQMGAAVVHVSSELCYVWGMLHLSETLPKLNF